MNFQYWLVHAYCFIVDASTMIGGGVVAYSLFITCCLCYDASDEFDHIYQRSCAS